MPFHARPCPSMPFHALQAIMPDAMEQGLEQALAQFGAWWASVPREQSEGRRACGPRVTVALTHLDLLPGLVSNGHLLAKLWPDFRGRTGDVDAALSYLRARIEHAARAAVPSVPAPPVVCVGILDRHEVAASVWPVVMHRMAEAAPRAREEGGEAVPSRPRRAASWGGPRIRCVVRRLRALVA